MKRIDDSMVFAHARVELDDGVTYTPFIHPDGFVGLICDREGHQREFLYLNPSDHTDGDVPNVFLYHGMSGHPALDGAAHHYLVLQD